MYVHVAIYIDERLKAKWIMMAKLSTIVTISYIIRKSH